MNVIIKPTPQEIIEFFSDLFKIWVDAAVNEGREYHVALSGGSTPKILFKHWVEKYKTNIAWDRVHFYWGDERCVPPGDEESNYKMAKELLFDYVPVRKENIHRIRGENDPHKESERYSKEMFDFVPIENGKPRLDLNILGMGDDGHTASIFPNQMELLNDTHTCQVAVHPESGQKRVTMTGPILSNAVRVIFLVIGSSKAKIFSEIRNQEGKYADYPATHINAVSRLEWYVDRACAG